MIAGANSSRVFTTAWFSKAARKARIQEAELCAAILEVVRGQVGDLGGGVFKKRLNKNMHRSIILARGRQYWIYAYLFAKKDRANIDDDELAAFRALAAVYRKKTEAEIAIDIGTRELTEICDGA